MRKAESGGRVSGGAAMRLLSDTVRKQWCPLTLALVVSIAGSVASLTQPWLMGKVIEGATHRTRGESPLSSLFLLVAVIVGSGVLSAGGQILLGRTGERAVLLHRKEVARRILHLPMTIAERFSAGDLASRVCADVAGIRTALASGVVDLLGRLVLIIGCFIAMAMIDSELLVLTMLVAGITLVVIVVASSRIVHYAKAAQDSLGVVSGRMVDAVNHLKSVRSSGGEDEIFNDVVGDCVDVRNANISSLTVEALVSALSGLALQGASIAVIGVGGFKVASGRLETEKLVSFILYLFMMIAPLTMMFGAVSIISNALGSIQRVCEVLELGEEATQPAAVESVEYGEVVDREGVGLGVEFERVEFGYGEDPILRGVSIQIPPGSRCAVVGASGAGKSTMLALIERFYLEDSGSVRIGGVPASQVPLPILRSHIGYVEQGAEVINGTLRQNLTLGNPRATDDECWEMLRQVRLERVAQRAGDGLDTRLGERGLRLSGGESQRLSLARALLRRPKLLLLDEPTAALDSVNEEAIQAAIDRVSRGTTVVTVAHRLATVVHSQLIIVVEGGKILDSGTHEELLDRCDHYRSLAQRQLLDRRDG